MRFPDGRIVNLVAWLDVDTLSNWIAKQNEGPAQVNQTDRDTGLFATALILIAGLVFRLPDLDGRSTSYALGITADTTLGAKISPLADQNSGLSGVYPLFRGAEAYAARVVLCGQQSSP